MDYEKIREEVPAEEQQLYIDAKLELRRIEEMAKLPDSEYEEMLENIRTNGDDIQLEQFMETYISISEYERIKRENEAWINEIDSKYGVEEERRKEEIHIEALRKRPQLERLQRYYERNGSNIMRNVDFASLSDEDVLRLYDEVTFGIDNETLKSMLNDDIRRRVGKTDGGNTTGNGGVEGYIEKFKSESEEIKEQLNKIKSSLVLDDENLDLTDAVKDLTSELSEISKAADDLVEMINASKLVNENAVFSMTPEEIKSTIKGFKERLKEIKQHQIDKYNARVDATNRLLDELRGMEGIDTSLIPDNISRCDASVTDWRNIKYLEQIDYNKLVEVNKKIAEISDKSREEKVDLEADMMAIENEIAEIDSKINDEMSLDDVKTSKEDIIRVSNRIHDFKSKLDHNKDNITEEEYNSYLERINDAQADLADMYIRLPLNKFNNDYKELLEKLNDLERNVNYFRDEVERDFSHVDEHRVEGHKQDLETYESRLTEIKEDIVKRHADGKIDDNQYNELAKKVEEIEEVLKETRGRIHEPQMIKDVDIFAYLNGRIDGIEKALDALEKQVESLEKPIKDREVRKQIDKIINELEKEIKYLENILENNKEEDPEKYKETKERLDKVKERLEKVSKNYRKKCPLLIRSFKNAKEFYKKHKKACLIIAGLAALSIAFAPILIPAIMHGNIMIGSTAPALSGFVNFVNNILGGMIGATKSANGLWILANGVMLNPTLASTSLLKGLATVGLASSPYVATLMAPAIMGVKKLVEKMKNLELKQKIEEKFKKEKEKKAKKEPKVKKDGTKKAAKKTEDEIIQMFKKYRKSGMSAKEFAEAEGLTEEEVILLEYYESRMKSNMEEKAETSGKGRR